VVCLHPFQQFSVEGTIDHPPASVGRAVFSERTRVAEGGISSVLLPLAHLVGPPKRKELVVRTDIDIPLDVIGEC
jgi:hypothetical protein